MGFFKRKKKITLEGERTRQENRLAEEFLADDVDDSKKIQHYILSCCEQMIQSNKELEEQKSEYRIVTDYLNDIQLLESLSAEEMSEIRDAAENVQNLNRLRDEYQNTKRGISDVQFVQMQREEDRIPDAIERLRSNEAYQNTVKKDMNYLEGEKTQWHYNKLELMQQQKMLKSLSFVLPGIFAVCVAILVVLQVGFHQDTTYAWLLIFFVAAAGAFAIYVKMSMNQTQIRKSEVNLNHAIVLLNKVKFKYVHVTNAVDYAREKYHVKNSYEFNYLWEQYLNEVREREKFRQTNEDLQYYNGKLVRLLKRYRLYDATVWINQSSALIDKKEMVEVKHNLIVRRQKLRSQMEYTQGHIKQRRDEIDGILKKKHMDTPQIRQIIDSIDQMDVG